MYADLPGLELTEVLFPPVLELKECATKPGFSYFCCCFCENMPVRDTLRKGDRLTGGGGSPPGQGRCSSRSVSGHLRQLVILNWKQRCE